MSRLCEIVVVLVLFILWRVRQQQLLLLLLTAKPMLDLSLFLLQKQGSGPRAKSQSIWIQFCTHLLLYGVHCWADLDRYRRVGGSRPNQNDYFFVILVTHPKSSRRIAAISAANRQSGGEDGCYHEKFRNFVAWAEPDPTRNKSITSKAMQFRQDIITRICCYT